MRKTTATFFTLLMLSPSVGLAMGCSEGHDMMKPAETAQISCAEGTVLDAESNLCVPTTG